MSEGYSPANAIFINDRLNLLRYPNGPLGGFTPVTPTADGTWGTPPSDLDHATDGDITTATGEGSTIAGGAGDIGSLIFDMGSAKWVEVKALVGIRTSASFINVTIDFSDDGNTWNKTSYSTLTTTNSGTEHIRPLINSSGYARYFRVRATVNGAATGYAKFYQVIAKEIIP